MTIDATTAAPTESVQPPVVTSKRSSIPWKTISLVAKRALTFAACALLTYVSAGKLPLAWVAGSFVAGAAASAVAKAYNVRVLSRRVHTANAQFASFVLLAGISKYVANAQPFSGLAASALFGSLAYRQAAAFRS